MVTEYVFMKSLSKEIGQATRKPIPDGLTWEQTVNTYLKYLPTSQARFAFGFIYLTGQRASEALETRRSHIQLKTLSTGLEALVVDSLTYKNMTHMRREICIPMNRREKPIVENCLRHIQDMNLEAKVLPVTRQTLWNWLSTVTVEGVRALDVRQRALVDIDVHVYPHFLRHTRATHMADYYNLDHQGMMAYFGWKDANMPNYYVRGGWRFLARRFGLDKQQINAEDEQQASQNEKELSISDYLDSHNTFKEGM